MSWYSDLAKLLSKGGKAVAKTFKSTGKEGTKLAKSAASEAKSASKAKEIVKSPNFIHGEEAKKAAEGASSSAKKAAEGVSSSAKSIPEDAKINTTAKRAVSPETPKPAPVESPPTDIRNRKGLSGWFTGNFHEKVQTAKNVAQIPIYAAAGVPALAIGASSTKSWIEGNGILHGAMTGAFGQDTTDQIKNNGIAGGVKSVLFGDDYANDAIAPALVKNIFGDDCIENVRNGCQNLMSSITSGRQAQTVPPVIGYDANGQPIYGVMPDASMMQPTSSPFGSINNMVSNITGGKLNTMNALELIAAAYMMFSSRFGWMGKIGSILLGGNVAKDMQARQQAQLQSQLQSQQMMQQQVLMPQMLAAPMYQEPAPEEDNVVFRMRR